jgi:hypothetical protein
MKIEYFTVGKEFQVIEDINYFDISIGPFCIPKGTRVIVDSCDGSKVNFHEKQSGMTFGMLFFLHPKLLDFFYPI